ncbi:asparagine synthase (glutamine-hydrolyzing) [Psychroserpens ponticola]|uniref:asparagine synthase (glutamine-hydrolyzing) n=1 Tax=Psychroserpens ponticola TaxID=2932268 RepID=A0ABY7S2F7_9FLAO|nr:asparagine synthase (glutamine-hydrolyzing) [Psychroserpens ponticola]WCO03096.1 asparagine synthase (glutamine-hydrolyzing) [Psychroserpens ponticola]
MCGINGILYKSSTDEQTIRQSLTKMNDLIIHRGPDEDGTYSFTGDNFGLGMAMRRLSIIDLSSGQQPMYSNDKSIVIVFNGEIYNYKTLRAQLITDGIQLHTNSDTEVILKLYEQKGVEAFKLLDGMFAFSIYDATINKVFIARDFFGEKPLYYTENNNKICWASELKSLVNQLDYKPEISKKGINLYFKLTYIPAPFTIYEGVNKLEANKYIVYDTNTFEHQIETIHKENSQTKSNLSFNDAKKEVKQRVFDSVESRSISDVPLGTFLSGGVDSSVVSLCLSEMKDSKIETFSIGFEKASYDESDKSRVVAERIGSNHHEFIINENDLKHNVNDILLNFDEPFADSSSLPTFLVSNKTKSNVTVALTGDGGDEVFGGYNKYYVGKLNQKYTNVVPKVLHNQIDKFSNSFLRRKDDNRGFKYKLNKLIKTISYDDDYYWGIISLGFQNDEINQFLNPEFQSPGVFEYYKAATQISSPKSLNDFRTIDRHMSLEGDMLVKVDRTSMMNSLECRAPFLNRELFEFTMTLPEDYLIKKWSKKHILKEAFKDDFPEGFLEKSKQGFGVPVGDWLRDGLRKELESYIDLNFLKQQSIFNTSAMITLVSNHLSGKQDNTFKVWTYFCFQKWYTHTYNN